MAPAPRPALRGSAPLFAAMIWAKSRTRWKMICSALGARRRLRFSMWLITSARFPCRSICATSASGSRRRWVRPPPPPALWPLAPSPLPRSQQRPAPSPLPALSSPLWPAGPPARRSISAPIPPPRLPRCKPIWPVSPPGRSTTRPMRLPALSSPSPPKPLAPLPTASPLPHRPVPMPRHQTPPCWAARMSIPSTLGRLPCPRCQWKSAIPISPPRSGG